MDKAIVVSLLREHLANECYRSWVPPYRKVRWSMRDHASVSEHVGGHFRRHAFCASTDAALACVCKHEIVHRLHRQPKRRRVGD